MCSESQSNDLETTVPSEYECPICMKLLVLPVTTACGHTFCQSCLEKARSVRPVCPCCREPLAGGRRPNVALLNLIQRQFPEIYAQRESDRSNVPEVAREARSKPVIMLTPLDDFLLRQLECRFPGDSVTFRTSSEAVIRKLRLAYGARETVGVEICRLDNSPSVTTPAMLGYMAHVEEFLASPDNYRNEAIAKLSVCGRWESHNAERNQEDDLVVVQPICDEGWNSNDENNFEKYRELLSQLNNELERQCLISGIAGQNTFRRLYGSFPTFDPQNLLAEEVESNSFYYAKVLRAPLAIKQQWFCMRNTSERLTCVLEFIRTNGGAYSILRLSDDGELSYSSHLDSMMNHLVIIGGVCFLIWIIYSTGREVFDSSIAATLAIIILGLIALRWKEIR